MTVSDVHALVFKKIWKGFFFFLLFYQHLPLECCIYFRMQYSPGHTVLQYKQSSISDACVQRGKEIKEHHFYKQKDLSLYFLVLLKYRKISKIIANFLKKHFVSHTGNSNVVHWLIFYIFTYTRKEKHD